MTTRPTPERLAEIRAKDYEGGDAEDVLDAALDVADLLAEVDALSAWRDGAVNAAVIGGGAYRAEIDALRADLAERTRERDELREAVREHLTASGYLTDDRAGPLEAVEDAGDLLKRLTRERDAAVQSVDAVVARCVTAESERDMARAACDGVLLALKERDRLAAEVAVVRAAYEADARVACPSCPHAGGHVCAGVRAPLPEASEAVRQMAEDAAVGRAARAVGEWNRIVERLHDVDALRAQRDAAVRVVEAARALAEASISTAYRGALYARVCAHGEIDMRLLMDALRCALADFDAGAARSWRTP